MGHDRALPRALTQRHLQQASEQVDPAMSGTLCTVQSIKYLPYFADSSKFFFSGRGLPTEISLASGIPSCLSLPQL